MLSIKCVTCETIITLVDVTTALTKQTLFDVGFTKLLLCQLLKTQLYSQFFTSMNHVRLRFEGRLQNLQHDIASFLDHSCVYNFVYLVSKDCSGQGNSLIWPPTHRVCQ